MEVRIFRVEISMPESIDLVYAQQLAEMQVPIFAYHTDTGIPCDVQCVCMPRKAPFVYPSSNPNPKPMPRLSCIIILQSESA